MDIQTCHYNMDYGTLDIHVADGGRLHLICRSVERELSISPPAQSHLRLLLDEEPETYATLYLNGELQAYCDLVTRSHNSRAAAIEKQMVQHFAGGKNYAAAIVRELMMYNA